MKRLYFLVASLLASSALIAQVGIHGDVTLQSKTTLGIFGPSLALVSGRIESNTNETANVYLSPTTNWEEASHNSYVGTSLEVDQRDDFIFPIGDGGTLHPMAVHSANNATVKAIYMNHAHLNNSLAPRLEKLAPFFWEIDAPNPLIISLTWHPESAISQLTNAVEAIVLLGFDGMEWKEIPATVRAQDLLSSSSSDLTVGSITSDSEVNLSNFEALTLGAKIYKSGVYISDAFSPDGDGNNDFWYIQYAEQYPKMKIRVFNRWGAEVYESVNGYQNNWDGSYKKNKNKLPSSSYLYQIDLEGDGDIDHQGWVFIQH